MNYQETLDYLFAQLPMYQRVGKAAFKKDLGNIIALCTYLEQPQAAFPAIHIAGTNGKGSTSYLLAAILQAAGYKVGLYSSPHYRDFRERIRINGQPIAEEAVVQFVSQIQPFLQETQASFFEITVGMAFEHFKNEQVDIAVIETGLGGRLDSTNIITPELSIITNIGWDHTDMLGDTLPKIAFEKAGIIKPGVPVVLGEEQAEVLPVFEQVASERKAPLLLASRSYQTQHLAQQGSSQLVEVKKEDTLLFEQLELDLSGNYQLKNLATVLMAVDQLRKQGYSISEQALKQGCAEVRALTGMLGRWEILQASSPMIICDSAHNPDGLAYVTEALRALPHERLHIVFGMVREKAPEKLLSLLPSEAHFYCCAAKIPRALEVEALLAAAQRLGLAASGHAGVAEALAAAQAAAGKDDLIFVGGSIFVVAEVV